MLILTSLKIEKFIFQNDIPALTNKTSKYIF